ncbi:NUDIX hydrolase [bacterium]|nr:NUDIX hydrolase [bacterium]
MAKEKQKNIAVVVDGIILKQNKILLVKRTIYPFKGFWVLPGGHVEYGETVEQALKREMKEETNLSILNPVLFGVYSDPKRDPRQASVSIVFVCKKYKGKVFLNKEAVDFKFFSLSSLPKKIGFDHKKIIKDFILASKLSS